MPVTPRQLSTWKSQGRKITALTAWDWSIAEILDEAGVDVILVGDSLAMVTLGYANTLPVTLEQMIHHASAVRRGVRQALTICDLPFMSYQESTTQALHNAGRVLKETGVQGVKLEGGSPHIVEVVARLTDIGIPVMGHVGLTPQSVHRLGWKQQGTSDADAITILDQAKQLAEAGAFAVILEHIPSTLADQLTQTLAIPTIGIGAGNRCDGQVLVTADVLGLSQHAPPFAKAYADLRGTIQKAVSAYATDVSNGDFPPGKS
ncbi:MAG: 3-methyl-2-oxobutanoate hydroxymethyltransferase [Cyanobacteria bacterium P01_H01_bin.15]